MHSLYTKANKLSREVIGAAIEVHRHLGPGLLESVYEKCLIHELTLRNLHVAQQQSVRIQYKDACFEEGLRFDLLVGGCILIELKAIRDVMPIHKAQVISYLKLLDVPLGLLINFHEVRLVDGISRLLLPNANQ